MAKKQITIIDEWKGVRVPQPPELKPVKVDPRTGALFILDIQNQMCCIERRPRCVTTIPGIQKLLKEARNRGMPVVFTVTRQAKKDDIREEVTPLPEEPVVKGFVDIFFTTELEDILKTKDIRTVILVGTSAHGAVLHTAVGAVKGIGSRHTGRRRDYRCRRNIVSDCFLLLFSHKRKAQIYVVDLTQLFSS